MELVRGGVAIYVKDNIECAILDIPVPPELEVIWINLKCSRLPRGISSIVVCAIYITTDSPYQLLLERHICETIDLIRSRSLQTGFCIMGDFNRMNINYILRNNCLKQIVNFPTRELATLDFILTNFETKYHTPEAMSPLGFSDHICILWKPKVQAIKNVVKSISVRPLYDTRIRSFGTWIVSQNWNDIYSCISTQSKVDAFYYKLITAINKFFPLKNIKTHNTNKPWLTQNIRNSISERQKAFKSNNLTHWKACRNKVKREIIKAKVKFNVDRVRHLQKTDPGKWHQQVRVMKNTKKIDLNIPVPEISPLDHKSIANVINDLFTNISAHIPILNKTQLPAFLPSDKPAPKLYPWDIYKKLRSIKENKACGPDLVPPKIVKLFAMEFCEPLCDILNCSFSEGIVPSQWKKAVVVPVPKVQPPTIDKLRPISITSVFAKVAEEFITDWILQDISSKIDVNQFGNVKGLSTAHYLTHLVHYLCQGAENKHNVGTMVLTDFSKAFDLIDHTILVNKIIDIGVRGALVPWLCDFLFMRMQCVKYNGTLSNYSYLKAGVPQGTKLGPSLYVSRS
ncbi:uncharacterized protein [Antedon mediterranea]|uniref:uncharacterized protein n=1 Tax=Antedon mediterranea TaxID=105859 RepID=UPI003AF5FC6A